MTATFPRFSSLNAEQFQAVRFSERLSELCSELEALKALVEHQCLSAIVLVTTVVYLFTRTVESVWVLPFVLPIIAIGIASLQHALTLYRHHVRQETLPALCEGIGRLRHTIGHAPDLCLDRMVRAALLPRHSLGVIEDVVHGEHQGRHLSLAMVDLWHSVDDDPFVQDVGDAFHGVVVSIHWPDAPGALPTDDLTPLIDGASQVELAWSEGYLMLAIPCQQNPFDLGGLFLRPEQVTIGLLRMASVMQIPHRLIDFMRDRESVISGSS